MPKNITHEFSLVTFGGNVQLPVTQADGVQYFGYYDEFLSGEPFLHLADGFTYRDIDTAISNNAPDVLITRNMTGFIGVYGNTVVKYSTGNVLRTALNTLAMKHALDYMRLSDPLAPQVPHILGGYSSPSGGITVSEYVETLGAIEDQPIEVKEAFQVGKAARIELYQKAAHMAGISDDGGFNDTSESTALAYAPDALTSPLSRLVRFTFDSLTGSPKDLTTMSGN